MAVNPWCLMLHDMDIYIYTRIYLLNSNVLYLGIAMIYIYMDYMMLYKLDLTGLDFQDCGLQKAVIAP